MPTVPDGFPWRRLARGFQGELYATVGGIGVGEVWEEGELVNKQGDSRRLLQVNSWRAWETVDELEYSPSGQRVKVVTQGQVSVHLTIVEAVIADGALLADVLTAIRSGRHLVLDFLGRLEPPRGQGTGARVGDYVINDCVVVGDVELMNIDPSGLVMRNWTLRGNTIPNLQQAFVG